MKVAPGPEDVVALNWNGRPMALTACARRSIGQLLRPSAKSNGIYSVALDDPCAKATKISISQKAPGYQHWVGLCFIERCSLSHGAPLLAATLVEGPARVALFTLTKDAGQALALEPLKVQPPPLANAGRKAFNSVALSENGDVYATVEDFFQKHEASHPQPRVKGADSAPVNGKLVKNAVYHWREGMPRWELVAWNIEGANGIGISKDQRKLYVNAYTGKCTWAFVRNEKTGELLHGKPQRFPTPEGYHPDNIKISSEGDILICGSSPRGFGQAAFYTVLKLVFGTSLGISPQGAVFRIQAEGNQISRVRELPKSYAMPSGVAQQGKWWVASQLFDDELFIWEAPARLE